MGFSGQTIQLKEWKRQMQAETEPEVTAEIGNHSTADQEFTLINTYTTDRKTGIIETA
jgi:hypothetical protein